MQDQNNPLQVYNQRNIRIYHLIGAMDTVTLIKE